MFDELGPYSLNSRVDELDLTLPSHWRVARFGRIARMRKHIGCTDLELLSVYLGRGVIPYSEGSKRVHAPSEDLSSYQLVEPGDFVMNNQQAWRGSVGVSGLRGIVSPAYLVFAMADSLTPGYGRFLLDSPVMVTQYVKASKGVGDIQRTVHWPSLRMAALPIPPADEQQAIVTYLSHAHQRINNAIATKRMLKSLLEEQKRAVVNRLVMRGTDRGQDFVDTNTPWIGEIPAHWNLRAARYLFRAVTRPVVDPELPQLSLTRSAGLIRSGAEGSGTQAAEGAKNMQQCNWGDFVLNKYRAHMGLFRWCKEPGLVTRNYTVLEPTGLVNRDYFEYLFLDPVFADGLRVNARGVGEGMSPLYTSTLMGMKMPVPPLLEQQEIVAAIATATDRIDASARGVAREIILLEEFRTRLTSDVVTGQLDVRSIAASLPPIEFADVFAAAAAAVDGDDDETADEVGMEGV